MPVTHSFEIEIELDGSVAPYRPATMWDPAEGGNVEDLAIADVGVLERNRSAPLTASNAWLRHSILAGVDTSNPEVQKLLDNLLTYVRRDAETAVIDADLSRAA